MGFFKQKKDIELLVEYTNLSTPSKFTLVPGSTDTPVVSYTLDCDYTLYKENYKELQNQLSKFLQVEQQLIKKLDFQAESSFIYIFKNASVMSLPNNLEKLENAKYQKPYNVYPRFQNLLSQLAMSIDTKVLESIKGRFFWNIINEYTKEDYEYTLIDIYRLIYYYEWVYLIPLYQSISPSIEDNKLNITTK